VVGSNLTTNEENFYLRKFAANILKTPNLDHHRTGDVMTLIDALSGKSGKLATMADLYAKKASLVIGSDLALEHPMISWWLRANFRHHQGHIYAVTPGPVREDKYSVQSVRAAAPADYFAAIESLRDKLKGEPELVILFNDAIKGEDVRRLV